MYDGFDMKASVLVEGGTMRLLCGTAKYECQIHYVRIRLGARRCKHAQGEEVIGNTDQRAASALCTGPRHHIFSRQVVMETNL